MNKLKKRVLTLFSIATLVLVLPVSVDAQITGPDLSRLGGIPISRLPLVNLIAQVINILLLIGAVIAFLYLLWGGFQYLTAGANEEQATGGRKIIINALIGIAIIFLSYGLVRFVINSLRTGGEGTPINDIGQLEQGY